MAIRRQIQKKKKIRKREIPSAWAKVHEAALHKVTQDVWEAIKSESKVPTEAVHKMETIRAGLDHSKPADLPKSIQEPLQELLQGIGHDIWVQNPELMSPEKATSFGLLYTTVFRCHHCLSDDFRAHEFRTISLNIHALQLNYPEKYDTAAKYMAGLVSGWDKKGVEVKVNVDSLMKMCETAANPPFEGKRPLTRPQLAAGYMFLEAVPQSKVGKGLDATQLSSISQSLRDGKWLKGEMTESNKGQFNDFGSENQETARKGGSKRSKR